MMSISQNTIQLVVSMRTRKIRGFVLATDGRGLDNQRLTFVVLHTVTRHRLLPCYRFDIQLFVGSTINNKYMGRMPLPIGHCPPIEDGLGGQGAAAGHVHAQAVAGPLDSRGGVGILGYP